MTSLIVFFGVGKISVRFSEGSSNFFSEFLFRFKSLFLEFGEIEIVDNKSGWHNVTLVDILDE